jgi:hypothetical protein
MHKLRVVALLIFTAGCAKKHSQGTVNNIDQVKERYQTYSQFAAEYASQYDGNFITDSCDSLLFTGLYYSIGGTNVSISAARDDSGKWHRRSLAADECYPQTSKSSISRDMILGLLWGLWANGDLADLKDLIAYGDSHNWTLGEGDASRVVMTPAIISTMYLIQEDLGGEKAGTRGDFPIVADKSLVGFEAHLAVLHILLRGKLVGASDGQVEFLKSQAERQPKNALFQLAYHGYYDGEQSAAIELLMDEGQWPKDRPPSTDEHCEFWLWQRDDGDDYQPCQPHKDHSGADWLFAAKLLME